MVFYARPLGQEQSDLEKHLSRTADSAKSLVEGLGIEETAYFTGLLHDLGKLNPYYQTLFATSEQERLCVEQKLQQEYVRVHSVFSALAAYRLLRKMPYPDKVRVNVVCAVASHHTGLTPYHKVFAPLSSNDKRMRKSLEGFFENLSLFIKTNNLRIDWAKLGNDRTIPQVNQYIAESQNFIQEYLEFNTVFAALILADRGSFFDWVKPKYTLACNTTALVRQGKLAHLRSEFQNSVLTENRFDEPLMVLKAPTGIGKTKMFLDIVNAISGRESLERVFYFSPLLALTEDFEGKLKQVTNSNAMSKVLVYNHTFTGSLAERENERPELPDDFFKSEEYFMRESFNYEFIVTTTQRLLMTLYSTKPIDKMKLLAFRNSFLIIDEVQTIPKFLLPNLISLLRNMAAKYNARVLFVSATIPETLRTLPMLKYPQKIEEVYLNATLKHITYIQKLDIKEVVAQGGRILIMVNTRRKAREMFDQISKFRDQVVYLSAGITKGQRRKTVLTINNESPVLAVSTQVLEAGVDISFDKIYREVAPLDNIVQTLGRLNREGKSEITPRLTVFQIDGDTAPYDDLEMKLSKKYLSNISNSRELYAELPSYYRELARAHATNSRMAAELEIKMRRLLFDDVWEFVKKKALPSDVGDVVFVPSRIEWETLKNAFLRGKVAYQRFAEFAAELPKPFVELDRKHGLQQMFDDDLMQKEVLLPKKECLADIYDPCVGLDKWALAGK